MKIWYDKPAFQKHPRWCDHILHIMNKSLQIGFCDLVHNNPASNRFLRLKDSSTSLKVFFTSFWSRAVVLYILNTRSTLSGAVLWKYISSNFFFTNLNRKRVHKIVVGWKFPSLQRGEMNSLLVCMLNLLFSGWNWLVIFEPLAYI